MAVDAVAEVKKYKSHRRVLMSTTDKLTTCYALLTHCTTTHTALPLLHTAAWSKWMRTE